jgi:hypothetical protein
MESSVKRGGPTHPKTYALAEALGVRRAHAVGILELMFHFTGQYAPAGDIGRYPDKRIAGALDWGGSVPKLIDSLVTCGWVDRHSVARLVVHDWHDHADRATLQRLSRSGQKPIESNEEDAENLCTQSETSGLHKNALPEPVPVPVPAEVALPAHTPEPTRTQLRVRPAPRAADMDKPASPHFKPWLTRWIELTGRSVNLDAAARTWLSVAFAGDEESIGACLESYGASDEVSRGVVCNPDKWLFDQARDRWQGRWPPPRAQQQNSRQQAAVDGFKTA